MLKSYKIVTYPIVVYDLASPDDLPLIIRLTKLTEPLAIVVIDLTKPSDGNVCIDIFRTTFRHGIK